MSAKPVISAAHARVPFLKVVASSDVPDIEDTNIIAGHVMTYIDPFNKTAPSILRMISWPLDNGRWVLGVLEETWSRGKLGQGRPESFMLWQTPQEFVLRSMAEEAVKFWAFNKTPGLIKRELLGHREPLEDAAPKPPIVAGGNTGKPLPFDRPALKSRPTAVSALRAQGVSQP